MSATKSYDGTWEEGGAISLPALGMEGSTKEEAHIAEL